MNEPDPLVEFWGALRLTSADHRQLITELADIVERYYQRSGTGTTDTVVHIGAIPGSTRTRLRHRPRTR